MTPPDGKPSGVFGFSIDLPVRNEWKNVDLMRSSVQNCFSAVFKELDGCHALSMVTGELLENAMKYGSWSDEEQVFRLLIHGDSRKARVVVQNPATNDDGTVDRLLEALEQIRSHPTAKDAYRARLLEFAESDGEGPRRLGLVRIAYEGNGVLDATFEEGVVTVTVQIKF